MLVRVVVSFVVICVLVVTAAADPSLRVASARPKLNLQLPMNFSADVVMSSTDKDLDCSAVLETSLSVPQQVQEPAEELRLAVQDKLLTIRCSRPLSKEEKQRIADTIAIGVGTLQIFGPIAWAVLRPIVERAIQGLAKVAQLGGGVLAGGAAAIGQSFSKSQNWRFSSPR